MELNELIEMVFTEYLKNDYYDMWELKNALYYFGDRTEVNDEFYGVFEQLKRIADIAEVGLMNTEVSELLEAIRKDKDEDEIGFECADIAIRLFNYCSRKRIDLEYYIERKHNINMQREKLHGKKV